MSLREKARLHLTEERGVYSRSWQDRRDLARAELIKMGETVQGWIVVGVYPSHHVARGVAENYSTIGLRPDWVRLWREYPDAPHIEGLARAEALQRRFETDVPEAVGYEFFTIHTENPNSPIALDWLTLLRERRLTRPRQRRGERDCFRLLNLKFVTRGPWRGLVY